MRKPLIGVTPLYDMPRESYWMLPNYMTSVERCGGIPVVLPLMDERSALEEIADRMDGFLFTGGEDVSPALYNEESSPACGPSSPLRDAHETALFELARERDLPMFGICRGLQFLNVMLGGTLYQDIPAEMPRRSTVAHRQDKPYDRPTHGVRIVPGTLLAEQFGLDRLEVNSLHHQGVKDMAPGLAGMAYAEDGLVEAIRHPAMRFLLAVQWHPEYSFDADPYAQKLFSLFVDACRG